MNETSGRVLVLAPDEHLGTAILVALREAAPGAQVDLAHSLEEAQQVVLHQKPDLFVLDVDATYDLGQEFLYDLRTSHPNARAIVLTAVHLAQQRERAAGIGAIHFLEKPFPHGDFVTLVEALLHPGGNQEERFQGKLSDLHIADIIQLKCMSGATSALEFTGPGGEKARIFFENGQVRHATAPGREGIDAFNEIVSWKGGMISEVSGLAQSPRTVDLDWQVLLMEAVRKIDEDRSAQQQAAAPAQRPGSRRVLVIDDSVMLLNFVKEILSEAHYDVVASGTAAEGLHAAAEQTPHLILLDYVLPDMKGDEVLRRFLESPGTASVPVVYMSGFGADLHSAPNQNPNVIGSLNKPFTSELLLKTVEKYMPQETHPPESQAQPEPKAEPPPETAPQPAQTDWPAGDPWSMPRSETLAPETEPTIALEPAATTSEPDAGLPNESSETEKIETAVGGGGNDAWWNAPSTPAPWASANPETSAVGFAAPAQPNEQFNPAPVAIAPYEAPAPQPQGYATSTPAATNGNAFFSGDTSFFSLTWALHAIAEQKLTGVLRSFWDKEAVELLARDGQILLVTTRDPELYCPEAPITLVNIDEAQTVGARQRQRETGCPLFLTLAQEGLIIREPAVQLVQHYGQKLFAQLWCAPRARFVFEQTPSLPDYVADIPAEEDIDHWALSTLRFIQFGDLGNRANYDGALIPAYTRNGFERVQKLRLTVAEAQFASQFNGVRSIAQIAKNLRLDLKFARVTLFRFLALEIIDCWPPTVVTGKPEKRGFFGRLFSE